MRRAFVLALGLAVTGACAPAPPDPAKLAVGTIRPSVEIITPEPSKTPKPTASPSPTPTPRASGRPTPGGTRITPSPSASPTERTLVIAIISAQYGHLDITVTVPDALCTAGAELPDGTTVLQSYFAPQRPDRLGHVLWTYPKSPTVKKGGGLYTITCASGLQRLTRHANFSVE